MVVISFLNRCKRWNLIKQIEERPEITQIKLMISIVRHKLHDQKSKEEMGEELLVCFWRDNPLCTRASSFMRFLDHTQRRATVGRTPLDE